MIREIRRKSLLKNISDHLTDFKLVFFFAIFTLVIGITFYLTRKPQDIRQRAFGPGMEFGFNAHLSSNGTLSLSQFESNVDSIVSSNKQWIRFTIVPSDIAAENVNTTPQNTTAPTPTNAPTNTPTPTPIDTVLGISSDPIQWNTTNLSIYDAAIDYAYTKGLKILISTSTPDFAKNYAFTDYQTVTDQYFRFLSGRYGGKIAVWQAFDNANIKNYSDSSVLPSLDTGYLSNFNDVLGTAKNAIKAGSANAIVTTSAGGNPLNDTLVANWNQFFDVVNSNVDIISVEMYPNSDVTEISKLSSIIEGLRSKYTKDVVVTETGLCTQNGLYTESDQQNYVTQAIDNIKLSSAKLILQYELEDRNPTNDTCEGSYGIVKADGTPKTSFNAVVTSLNPPPTPTPTPTPSNTPTPTPIPTATPTPSNQGYLRVTVLPTTITATIRILDSRGKQVLLTGTGSIDLTPFPPGNYYVSFAYPKTGGLRTPKTTAFKIILNKTTYILGDFTTGKTTVNYQ